MMRTDHHCDSVDQPVLNHPAGMPSMVHCTHASLHVVDKLVTTMA